MTAVSVVLTSLVGIIFALAVACFVNQAPPTSAWLCCDDFIGLQQNLTEVTFSTKTSYPFNAQVKDETVYNECTATKMYVVIRHGSRFPSRKNIASFDKVLSKIKSLKHSTNIASELSKWNNPFLVERSEYLSETGMKELYCLAKRFQRRFPHLFVKNAISFGSTYKERTLSSAQSFGYGLFEGTGPLNGFQPVQIDVGCSTGDTLLRFFDECPRYDVDSHHNKTLRKFIDQYFDTPSFQSVISEVQSKLDTNRIIWNVTANDVLNMYDICSYELANFRHSNWCSLFSTLSLQILEYYRDLKNYWVKGYGNTLNWRMSCPLVEDIISNLSKSSKELVIAKFAHAETLIPLNCAFGLYNGNSLSPDKYRGKRNFRLGNFSPFAGNLGFVVYVCPNDNGSNESFVRVLSNEKPIAISHPLCKVKGNMCPLDKLASIVKEITNNLITFQCSLSEFCKA